MSTFRIFFTRTIELRTFVDVEAFHLGDARAQALGIAKVQSGDAMVYEMDWCLQKPSPVRVVRIEEIKDERNIH